MVTKKNKTGIPSRGKSEAKRPSSAAAVQAIPEETRDGKCGKNQGHSFRQSDAGLCQEEVCVSGGTKSWAEKRSMACRQSSQLVF